jgi:hypothetical protein
VKDIAGVFLKKRIPLLNNGCNDKVNNQQLASQVATRGRTVETRREVVPSNTKKGLESDTQNAKSV